VKREWVTKLETFPHDSRFTKNWAPIGTMKWLTQQEMSKEPGDKKTFFYRKH